MSNNNGEEVVEHDSPKQIQSEKEMDKVEKEVKQKTKVTDYDA